MRLSVSVPRRWTPPAARSSSAIKPEQWATAPHGASAVGGWASAVGGPPAVAALLLQLCAVHGGLKSGLEARTQAMQTGLVEKQLTFRDVFTAVAIFFSLLALLIRVRCWRQAPISRLAAAH